MLETRTQARPIFPFPTSPIIRAVFAKVATTGTVQSPSFELVRVLFDQPSALGWFEVQSANGVRWLCHRDDMVKLFPIFGGA